MGNTYPSTRTFNGQNIALSLLICFKEESAFVLRKVALWAQCTLEPCTAWYAFRSPFSESSVGREGS